jgi:hypothetical protein
MTPVLWSYNLALKDKGKHNRSLKVAVRGPVFGPPLYIHTYRKTQGNQPSTVIMNEVSNRCIIDIRYDYESSSVTKCAPKTRLMTRSSVIQYLSTRDHDYAIAGTAILM